MAMMVAARTKVISGTPRPAAASSPRASERADQHEERHQRPTATNGRYDTPARRVRVFSGPTTQKRCDRRLWS